jgi:serine/threonine-protein kinase
MCGAPVQIAAGSTILDCAACGVPFVPRGATEVSLVVRSAAGAQALAGSISLSPEFRRRYGLGRVLGSGAIGMVYQATHLDSGRQVAVKFLTRLSDPAVLARFIREGRLMGRLQHPNVARILELESMDDYPYLVIELLEGGTLRARMTRSGKLACAEAIAIALDCLAGLAACHEIGIVHRDIKPENILFASSGVAKVADLGIARTDERDIELTRIGALLGTPRYMSPEQARGEPVGPGTDVYAMGVILYEAVVGRPPFSAASVAELLRMHEEVPAPPLSGQVEGVPARLVDLVDRCLAKHAADRPASAQAFAMELQRVADRLERRSGPRQIRTPPPAVPPPPTAPGVPVPVDRRRAAAVAACAGALVLALIGLLAGRERSEGRSGLPAVDPSGAALPASAETGAPAARPGCGDIEFDTDLSRIQQARARAEARIVPLRDAINFELKPRKALLADVLRIAVGADEEVREAAALAARFEQWLADRCRLTEAQRLAVMRSQLAHWLALARRAYLHQRAGKLARATGGSLDDMLPGGRALAGAADALVLQRYLRAAVKVLERSAAMPSTLGPAQVAALRDVYAASYHAYSVEWEPAGRTALDRTVRSFQAELGRLEGPVAELLNRTAMGLWYWGNADGSFTGDASSIVFGHARDWTLRDLKALSPFLSAESRTALARLNAEAARGFREQRAARGAR